MELGALLDDAERLPPATSRIEITGLTADSRRVSPGDLFAALPGTRVDGARFISDALAAGAAAVLAGDDVAADGQAPLIHVANPHQAFARAAARFYGSQPEAIVAVTGTSGKTSVVAFTRQILAAAGHRAASLGTLGIVSPSGSRPGALTTPDPVILHETLHGLADDGVTHAAIEASSHGLDQYRLDGVRLAAGAFTNIGRDHLDYHPSPEDYFRAKLRLFEELLPPGAGAVIDADRPEAERVARTARARDLRLITTGAAGADLRLVEAAPKGMAQRLTVKAGNREHRVVLPLAGAFQVSNALVAAGLAMAVGVEAGTALAAFETLQGAKGRLELVGRTAEGALVFVDYAHKPDAIENALAALRPATRNRLSIIIGAGGDRDRGKRPLMGAAAARHADVIYVTDDNPRSEDPATIRAEVLEGAPDAVEIADRGEAIAVAVAALKPGDVLLVAGKGHETGQIVGDTVRPFSDHDAVRRALGAEDAA